VGSGWLRREVAEERRLIHQTWALFRRDTGALVGGMILAGVCYMVVASVLVGIASAFLLTDSASLRDHLVLYAVVLFAIFLLVMSFVGGLIGIVARRVREGTAGRAADVFQGFGQFLPLALAAVVILGPSTALTAVLRHFAPHAGLLSAVIATVLELPFVYLLPVIVDERPAFRRALPASLRLLTRGGIGRTLIAVLSLVPVGVILDLPSSLGGPQMLWTLLVLVLEVVIGPYLLAYLVCMYFRARGEQHLIDQAIARPDLPRSPALKASNRGPANLLKRV
jgi:hypothetical protein